MFHSPSVPNRALEPYDPYGNDTLLYSYPLYDIFVPDWYVDNMTGEYWIGVAEFSNTTDDEGEGREGWREGGGGKERGGGREREGGGEGGRRG